MYKFCFKKFSHGFPVNIYLREMRYVIDKFLDCFSQQDRERYAHYNLHLRAWEIT